MGPGVVLYIEGEQILRWHGFWQTMGQQQSKVTHGAASLLCLLSVLSAQSATAAVSSSEPDASPNVAQRLAAVRERLESAKQEFGPAEQAGFRGQQHLALWEDTWINFNDGAYWEDIWTDFSN